MHRFVVIFSILAFTSACNETPTAQQASRDEPAEQSGPAQTSIADPQQGSLTDVDPTDRATRMDVGDTAPSFELQDQTGTARALDKMLADGNVALIFHRSADW